MILVDTSVWIDHLRQTEPLALGSIRNRPTVLGLLSELPTTTIASHAEVLGFVESQVL